MTRSKIILIITATLFIIVGSVSGFFVFKSYSATKFLEQYCEKDDPDMNLWKCPNLYNYSGGPTKFKEDCQAIGYLFYCHGMCGDGKCYLFNESAGKTCTRSKDCESKWCQPIDETCIENCEGICSSELPPNICTSVKTFTFKKVENGKVIDKKAGGSVCK